MWVTLVINGLDKGEIIVHLKHYELASKYGLNGGKVSKLEMRRDGEIIAHFDRGWIEEPEKDDQDAQAALYLALNGFN